MTLLVVFLASTDLNCLRRSILTPFQIVSRHPWTIKIANIFAASSDRKSAAVLSQHAEKLVILEEPAHSMLRY